MKKVDDYLDGILSASEEKEFSNAVDENDLLLDELQFRKDVRASIQDEGFANLRSALIKEGAKIREEPHRLAFQSRREKNVVFAMAATLALLIASGLLYVFLNGQLAKPEQLAQKYYHPAKSIQHLRSVEESDLMGANEAFDYYNNGDYARSLELFISVENKVVSNFYSGICYFELKDYQQAVQSFDFVLRNQHNLFIEQAQWYISLTYLKLGDVQKAEAMLTKISGSESPFAFRSGEILKKLD